MSAALRPLEWMREVRDDMGLSHTAKRVAVMVGLRMDGRTGTCWPTLETLAHDCGMDRSTVKRKLRELQAHHYLTITERYKDGRQRSNLLMMRTPTTTLRGGTTTPPQPVENPNETGLRGGTTTPREGGTTTPPQSVRGGAPQPPRSSESERSTKTSTTPVDNTPLTAVLQDLDHHLRIPDHRPPAVITDLAARRQARKAQA